MKFSSVIIQKTFFSDFFQFRCECFKKFAGNVSKEELSILKFKLVYFKLNLEITEMLESITSLVYFWFTGITAHKVNQNYELNIV